MTGRRLSPGWALLLVIVLGSVEACSSLPRIVILHDPLTSQEHVTLGEAYQAKGLREQATREFEAALRLQSEYVPALIGRGNLAYEANAFEEAEGFYRRALTASPEHPAANNNLALVHLARGERLDEAERLARNAVEREGAVRPYALDTLAKIYTRQGRYQEATLALAMAMAVVPVENTDLHEQLNRSKRELAAVYSLHE
jgi:tetratricopeptide (TPR) repeat protein